MKLKSIKSAKNLKNKRVLVRLDFDAPLKNGQVADDSRLKDALPTINYLLKKKARIILIGHLGRPKGRLVKKLSLKPVKDYLEKLLQVTSYKSQITLIPIERYVGDKVAKAVKAMQPGQIIMFENLRFSDREEANCQRFAKNLASLADIYVNNAFSVSHRAHASIDAIQKYLPSFLGFDIEDEIKKLSQVFKKPKRPLILIIGGAKTETKLPVIKGFLNKADYILVGGGIANTFFRALGFEVGRSLVDKNYTKQALKTFKKSQISNSKLQKNYQLLLPVDVITNKGIRKTDQVGKNEFILDIGPETIKLYLDIIKSAKTIIWNGPLGKIEDRQFAVGSHQVAKQLLKSKAKIIIGGGDTDKIFNGKKIPANVFISSGGGAMLEFLAGKKLPGLK